MSSEHITIKVTRRHIERGMKHVCHKCPIALAIQAQVKRKSVHVLSKRVHMYGETKGGVFYPFFRTPLPEAARKWVRDFDNSVWVEPITFKIRAPPPPEKD